MINITLHMSSNVVCLLLFAAELIYMDTDLLDFSADDTVDNGELYGGLNLQRVASSSSATLTPSGTPGATVDVVDSVTTSPAQPVDSYTSIAVSVPKPHTPASHAASLQSAQYKSPVSRNDQVSAAVAMTPRPDLLPKSSAVPAIPPRKPRVPAPDPAPGRSEAVPPKAMQPQPPLPHIRKPNVDSFFNRVYEMSTTENSQQSNKQCLIEDNGSAPPVPVPRTVVTGNSVQASAPASSDLTASLFDTPVPCESLSSGEQVRK